MSDSVIYPYPDNWDLTTLGQLCSEGGGGIQTGPFGSQLHAADYVDVGIPSIMPKNISIEGISTEDIAYITNQDAQRLSKYLVKEGDIVYSRRGDVEKCSLVTEKENGWLCGTGCLKVSLGIQNKVSPIFIHAYLSHPAVREWISRHAVGATMPNLNTSILSEVPVLIPPKKEREVIQNTWHDTTNKIILNHQINQTLEQMAQALFKSWFVDFDPVKAKISAKDAWINLHGEIPATDSPVYADYAQSLCVAAMSVISGKTTAQLEAFATQKPEQYQSLKATADLFPDAMQGSELGDVPEGWGLGTLSNLIDFNPKRILKKGVLAPYLDMKNVPTQGHLADDVILREMGSGTKFINGDTLLARITPCLENGKTAYVDFLENDEVGWGSTEFIVMRPQVGIPTSIGYFIARLDSFRNFAIQSMTGTSGRQRANTKALEDLSWVIYPIGLLEKFGVLSDSFLKYSRKRHDENQSLTQLRDTLLPKLLSGELSLNKKELNAL